ncbi:hypothetical protein LCGC14_1655170 [marine sediment metagenome]|uniref:Uncharacterized protein n=1 Tax=marine sediment metagenome TaxID=412755 RepID=A0A0F9II88_9ZZZZ
MVKIINKPIGRPNIELDYNRIFQMAKDQCTVAEIAAELECSEVTLAHDNDFRHTFKKGQEAGKTHLRRLQLRLAEGKDPVYERDDKGDIIFDGKGKPVIKESGFAPQASACIFLGKNQLGQMDTQNMNLHVEAPVTVLHKDYEKGKKEGKKDE